jgi:cytochrome c2
MRNQHLLVVVTIAAGLSFGVFSVTWIAQAQDDAAIATGARLFTDHGCYGCHHIGAFGTPIGPELSRIGAKYSREDLVRWLSDPKSQKPNAHMPKLDLSHADVVALAAFLSTHVATGSPPFIPTMLKPTGRRWRRSSRCRRWRCSARSFRS